MHIDAIFLGQLVDLLLKRGDLFVFVIARALEALGVGLGDLVEEALVLIDQHVFVSVAALTILPTVDCAKLSCRAVAPCDLTLTSSKTR